MQAEPLETPKPGDVKRTERVRAVLAHAAIILVDLIPLVNVVVVFLIWVSARQQSEFIRHHAMEALNFNIVWTGVLAAVQWLLQPPSSTVVVRLFGAALAIAAVMMAYMAAQGRIANYWPRIRLFR